MALRIFIGAIFAVIFMILRYFFIVNPQCGPHALGVTRKRATFWKTLWCSGSRCGIGYNRSEILEKAENKYSGGYGILFNDRYPNAPFLAVSWQPCRRGNITPRCLSSSYVGGNNKWRAYWRVTGSAVVNALCGVTGGMIGSLFSNDWVLADSRCMDLLL